ncbi:hypothetical protein E2C01_007683 [Portunus trituberculatus]|uniref:Uncharacterized protein n=1 Tax=Portunus trituberculatus TaxID=210409 RepID=A0A5B7D0S2_PORTR|nr:hypothetical protein [Portunus trituberculatus]
MEGMWMEDKWMGYGGENVNGKWVMVMVRGMGAEWRNSHHLRQYRSHKLAPGREGESNCVTVRLNGVYEAAYRC